MIYYTYRLNYLYFEILIYMKLLTFTLKKEQNLRVGAFKNGNIVDLSEAELPTDMVEFISLGDAGIDKAPIF